MSPCADFRWRFFELIVLVSRRQLAVEEAVARVFSRATDLERERCFLISYAEVMSKRFTFNRIYRRSVPCRTAKRIAAFGRRRGVEHRGTVPARALAMELETFTTSAQGNALLAKFIAIATLHGSTLRASVTIRLLKGVGPPQPTD